MKTRNIREVKKKIKKVKAKTAEMYLQENMLVRLNRLEELVEDLRYDGVDDSEEVEFTRLEIMEMMTFINSGLAGNDKGTHRTTRQIMEGICSKLNKMLKDTR